MEEWSVSALCRGAPRHGRVLAVARRLLRRRLSTAAAPPPRAGTTPARANASVVLDGGARLLMFGGCDAEGRPTDSLCGLDLAGLPGAAWRPLAATGAAPTPRCAVLRRGATARTRQTPPCRLARLPCARTCRWGHSAFVWGGRMWVFGGWDGGRHLDDLHSLDLRSLAWARVQQGGGRPDRALGKHKSFAAAALAPGAGVMLAFGAEPQVRRCTCQRSTGPEARASCTPPCSKPRAAEARPACPALRARPRRPAG